MAVVNAGYILTKPTKRSKLGGFRNSNYNILEI